MLRYLAAVAVVLAGAAQAQACPSQGCPAEQKLVCGKDGVTYFNDCVARCQGVDIQSWSACNEEYPLDRVSTLSTDGKKGTLSLAVINKYQNSGFNYAGPGFSTSFITDAHQVQFGKKVPAAAAGNSSSSRGRDTGGGGGRGNAIFFAVEDTAPNAVFMALDKPTYDKATAFMFDPQRKAVYVQKQSLVQKAFQLVESTSVLQDADQSGDMKAGPGAGGGGVNPRQQQPQREAARAAPAIATPAGGDLPDADTMKAMLNRFMAGGAGRKLLHIIGGDERTEIGDKAHQWPYTAVGHLQHRKGVCTGVMISNRAVLTAGHCIYSRKRRAWQENLVFIPARHRVNGQFVEPYGRIPYLTATTYSGWVQNGDDKDALQYDLAVVRLSDENIGYKTGWLGLAWDKKGFNGWVTTAGYASDKPRGSLWISKCKVAEKSGESSRFTYDCDITPGMSGSPVWESRTDGSFVVRAVNTYESCICCSTDCKCCNQHFNGGTGITALHYNNILAWR